MTVVFQINPNDRIKLADEGYAKFISGKFKQAHNKSLHSLQIQIHCWKDPDSTKRAIFGSGRLPALRLNRLQLRHHRG